MEPSAILATHRKALRDYHLLESIEAGIQLVGPEIKSIRNRQVSLEDSFARLDGSEVFLYNMHVSPYEQGGRYNVEPKRIRKLLLHRQQIERLYGLLSHKGVALVPLRLYLKHGLAKVELGLGKGKKLYEKRDTIRKREVERDLRRMVHTRQRRGSES
ncbi:MAG: SsrA-binding protein SmpB [Candidatus Omnitrophica bacterium]|nr:SsrA-binding protein SmpB [Candidatus Omnitrophota bacterium]